MVKKSRQAVLLTVTLVLFALTIHPQTNTNKLVTEKSKNYKNLAEKAIFGGFGSTTLSVIKTALPFVVIITGTMALLGFTKKTYGASDRTTQQKQKNIYFAAFLFLLAIIIAAYISGQL